MRKAYRYCHDKKKVVPAHEAVSKPESTNVQILGGADFRCISHTLPLNWPYAPRHDKEGRACFQSTTEVREAVAKARHDGEPVAFYRGAYSYE